MGQGEMRASDYNLVPGYRTDDDDAPPKKTPEIRHLVHANMVKFLTEEWGLTEEAASDHADALIAMADKFGERSQ